MKGLLLLFIAIAGGVIGWNMTDNITRKAIKNWLRRNAWGVILALTVVGVAIVVSANTTMRFL